MTQKYDYEIYKENMSKEPKNIISFKKFKDVVAHILTFIKKDFTD